MVTIRRTCPRGIVHDTEAVIRDAECQGGFLLLEVVYEVGREPIVMDLDKLVAVGPSMLVEKAHGMHKFMHNSRVINAMLKLEK